MELKGKGYIGDIQSVHDLHGSVNVSLVLKTTLTKKEIKDLYLLQNLDNFSLTANVEIEGPILTSDDRKYLNTILKPLKNEVVSIMKCSRSDDDDDDDEYLVFEMDGESHWTTGYFGEGTIFRKMVLDKKYTLEELGL